MASAELYVPWVGEFRATGSMAAARAHATGSALSRDGLLLVAGGDALASSESYGFATIKTDKDDYAPGTTVLITGTGWQPGETVSMTRSRGRDRPRGSRFSRSLADDSGRIANADFAPDFIHIGVRFYPDRPRARRQAQVTFTDATNVSKISVVGSQTPQSCMQAIPRRIPSL